MKRSSAFKTILMKTTGVLVALLVFFAFAPSARADEARIDITANPTELTDGGLVTFTFEIANYNTDYPMTDVAIAYNGTVYNVMEGQAIPPGGSARDITLTLSVAQSQLGKPIVFVVTWTRNGEPMSQEAEITIEQAENPVITVTRDVSKTNAKPGEQVIVTYTMKNTTKFDMTDVTLIDENISDEPIFLNETLRASRTMATDFTYTMGEESVVSAPVVTYTVNGKTKTYSSIDPLELTMVLVKLDMQITAGTPTISGVAFTFDVSNTGTQAVKNITITDERANKINETPFSLEPGETTTLSYLVVPVMTEPLRNVKFTLSGTDPFSEEYMLAPDDIYEVYPFVDASQISVTVRAETITPWTAVSGKISARIIITNHSAVELTGITVAETTIGVLKNYDILPAGDTSFDQEILLGSPRNLSITVKGFDPTGTNRELARCVMPVAYGTETAEPAAATPVPSGGKMSIFDGISDAITKVLIVLGVIMVLSLVVLVVLTALERSHAPRNFEDFDEPDDYDEKPKAKQRTPQAPQQEPDSEEIIYTRRMLSLKEEAQQEYEESPPPQLPAPKERKPNPVEHDPVPPPRTPQRTVQRADEVADRLVQKAHSRYTEAESTAAYRPASTQVRPYTPPDKQPEKSSAPRVFDYKKRPKPQPAAKQTVTRVHKDRHYRGDDEE